MDIKVGRKAIAEATEKLKNWGRWGKDDHIGTPEHLRVIARLRLLEMNVTQRALHPKPTAA